MTKRTKNVGHDSGGKSSSRWLSPGRPYTGDGKTRRSIFDKVGITFRGPDGKKIKKKS